MSTVEGDPRTERSGGKMNAVYEGVNATNSARRVTS